MDQTRRELFLSAVEQFADSIYRVAYRMSGSHELAQELVQETFLAAWKNLHQIQQPDRIRYWLMGILRNQFTKQLSQETRHRHEVLNLEPVTAAEDRVLKDIVYLPGGSENLRTDPTVKVYGRGSLARFIA